jgi:peptidoglycan/LPS O-acetylase OafA/YrhL
MTTDRRDTPGYRPDIDGLRAFSVLAVIGNHIDSKTFPGGYIGVDVFFVISGFVITASLWGTRHEQIGSFLANFFYRRVRRLAPALLISLLLTGVAVWLLVPATAEQYATAMAAVFGVSNIQLYFHQQDYFTPARDLHVFIHTWSLGVEEQFYLAFPLMLWVIAGGSVRGDRRRVFMAILAVLCVASLVAFCAVGARDREAAFYLMPMRFWEIGVGALLFLALDRNNMTARVLAVPGLAAMAIVGLLVLVLLPGNALSHAQSVIAAVFCAAVLIACLPQSALLNRIFSHPAPVYIGLISYPLYLWHWPVISIGHWTLPSHPGTTLLQLALIAGLAVATYECVERPFRHVRLRWPVSRLLALWAVIFFASSLVINHLSRKQRMLGIYSALAREAVAFLPLKSGKSFDPTCVVDGLKRPLRPETADLCTVLPRSPEKPTIWAIGDSHAGHLQGMLMTVHDQTGLGIHLVETPGVPFPMFPTVEFAPRVELYRQISDRIRPGDIVVLGRLFLMRDDAATPTLDVQDWQHELVKYAEGLASKGVHVVVVGPLPMFQFKAVQACRTIVFTSGACDIQRARIAGNVRVVMDTLRRSAERSANIHVFDMFELLCPAATERCSPLRDGKLIFRDRDHLNASGASSLAPHFIRFLSERSLLKLPE